MNSKLETVLVKYPRISNLVNQLLQLIRRGIARLADPSVWTKKRAWVLLALLLRFGYVFMNEHGLNPFKKSLVDDHVFLTGAATGIGRLLAIRFAKLGCKLTLSDVNIEGLKETLKLCQDVGCDKICIVECDVSKKSSIQTAAEVARKTFGSVTILVNNAGVVGGLPLEQLKDEVIEMTLRVNTTSHLDTIQEFLPAMIAQKRGHIVTIASMAGLVGVSRLTDYTASKHGALGIDDSVRLELHAKRHNSYVKTTCVCPYLIKTGMFEGAKSAFPFSLLEPEAVADRIIYAVRQNEPLVVIPWRGNIIFLLKMLPIGVADTIAKWLGANSSMHQFKGKGALEKRIPGL